MKKMLVFLFFAILFTGCTSHQKNLILKSEIIADQQDREIIDQLIKKFPKERKTSMGDLVLKIGMAFLDTPYVAHTLELGDKENLVINLRGLDCTTFAENCLAIARMLKSGDKGFDRFTEELQHIRYRNGIRNGYTSRLHYFSDWIYNNQEKRIVRDVSQEISHTIVPNRVNFMSTHPGSYVQLKNDTSLIPEIIRQENEITSHIAHYIPEIKLAKVEEKLRDGDIIGLTTNIKGMDISHVGILVRKNNRIHLLHASSSLKKVVISEDTLENYLLGSKSATGIMVARPL